MRPRGKISLWSENRRRRKERRRRAGRYLINAPVSPKPKRRRSCRRNRLSLGNYSRDSGVSYVRRIRVQIQISRCPNRTLAASGALTFSIGRWAVTRVFQFREEVPHHGAVIPRPSIGADGQKDSTSASAVRPSDRDQSSSRPLMGEGETSSLSERKLPF